MMQACCRRTGQQDVRATVRVWPQHSPPQYQLAEPLGRLLQCAQESRQGMLQRLWAYLDARGLLVRTYVHGAAPGLVPACVWAPAHPGLHSAACPTARTCVWDLFTALRANRWSSQRPEAIVLLLRVSPHIQHCVRHAACARASACRPAQGCQALIDLRGHSAPWRPGPCAELSGPSSTVPE